MSENKEMVRGTFLIALGVLVAFFDFRKLFKSKKV